MLPKIASNGSAYKARVCAQQKGVMKMKNFLGIFSIVAMVFILVACGGSEDASNDTNNAGSGVDDATGSEIVVGVSLSTLTNPFFLDVEDGIREVARENNVTVHIVGANDDAAVQSADIDDLLQLNLDLILINPVDADAIVTTIEYINNTHNIPVVTLDRSSEGGDIVSHVASNNVLGGVQAAEFIVANVGDGAIVVELEGQPGASAARERGEGFNSIADNSLNVVARQTANWSRAEGLSVLESILQTHPEIDAVFAHNDEMALGAVEALRALGMLDEVLVVGFDGIDDAVAAVQSGEMAATVAQQPVLMGRMALETAIAYLAGNQTEYSVDTPLQLIVD